MELGPTIAALRHLIATEDSAATLAAERQVEEFLNAAPNLGQKIENLRLLRNGILSALLKAEGYPRKQYAEAVMDFIDHRLRILEEQISN